jgi:hypothetical protein
LTDIDRLALLWLLVGLFWLVGWPALKWLVRKDYEANKGRYHDGTA